MKALNYIVIVILNSLFCPSLLGQDSKYALHVTNVFGLSDRLIKTPVSNGFSGLVVNPGGDLTEKEDAGFYLEGGILGEVFITPRIGMHTGLKMQRYQGDLTVSTTSSLAPLLGQGRDLSRFTEIRAREHDVYLAAPIGVSFRLASSKSLDIIAQFGINVQLYRNSGLVTNLIGASVEEEITNNYEISGYKALSAAPYLNLLFSYKLNDDFRLFGGFGGNHQVITSYEPQFYSSIRQYWRSAHIVYGASWMIPQDKKP
jgi:hypothetical protein